MRKDRRWGVLPSTRRFWREARQEKHFSLREWLHGYVYGRWPYMYIGLGTGEHRFTRIVLPPLRWMCRRLGLWQGPSRGSGPSEAAKSFADSYHGKVVPLAGAQQLLQVQRDIEIRDLERIIPYTTARDIVLHDPEHIAALRCPCRAVRQESCEPLDVCLIIGEPFASFITEHHPTRAKMISQEEALAVLEAEDRRGHVHHAFFKEGMLGRFYAICNCCSCCCGAMQAQRNGVPMLASSGYLCQMTDETLCTQCGQCLRNCQFAAIDQDARGRMQVDAGTCMGCGVCVNNCPSGALRLERAPEKGEPLEMGELMANELETLSQASVSPQS